jgi:hypothetical protein
MGKSLLYADLAVCEAKPEQSISKMRGMDCFAALAMTAPAVFRHCEPEAKQSIQRR